MSKDNETKKLGVELLEKRTAPFGVVMDQEVPDDPTGTTVGGGGAGEPAPVGNEPHVRPHGKSLEHQPLSKMVE